MKVKKFRIRSRIPTVGKILKAIMGVKQLPPDLEASLPMESDAFLKTVVPAAFYTTWSHDDVPPSFKPALQAAGLSKAIAVSALVATVGSEPEDFLSEMLMNGETQRSQVVTALAEDAADMSLNFLLRLLADEAKGDDCELAEPILIGDPALLAETLILLEAGQEDVTLDAAQHLSPRFTRVALVAWWPVSRKKRATTVAKKKSA